MKPKVVIGLSGGVDSTVAAYLLQQQGYEVIGVKLLLWKDELSDSEQVDGEKIEEKTEDDAARIARKLGIRYIERDHRDEFRREIVQYFIDTYRRGETPNPCVRCNRNIKFEKLLALADELGARYVATGHYADVQYNAETGRYELHRSPSMKDQTYALAQLTQEQLSRVLMPLARFTSKDETRRIAQSIDAAIASKSDSQEICFIPGDDYLDFLRRYGGESRRGDIVYKGAVVAAHGGIESFTIGQRKGLGITFGKPVYIVDIDPDLHRVTLGSNEELHRSDLTAGSVNWIAIPGIEEGQEIRAFAKIRYSASLALCTIRRDSVPKSTPDAAESGAGLLCGAHATGERIHVTFDTPQRAITPGQTIVFYTTANRPAEEAAARANHAALRPLTAEDLPHATSVLGSATILHR